MEFIQSIDNSVWMFIVNNIKCTFMDKFMVFITSLGNGAVIWIVIGILMMRSKKYRLYGRILLFTLLVGAITGNIVIKNLVGRVRPCNVNPLVEMIIERPTTYSFPSGHSLTSFAAAFVLLKTDKKFGIGAIVLAILIAFSRVYLYVHYFSDILVGALVGMIVALIMYNFMIHKFRNSQANNKTM